MGQKYFLFRPISSHWTNRLLQSIAFLILVSISIHAQAEGKRAIKARAMPVYPEIAKRMKIFGLVKIEATVDQEGKVTAVKSVEGNQILAVAAEESVKKTRFEPGSEVTTEEIEINFPRVN
jgi:TonB family protein